ncbi:signal peptidase II [Rhodococcus artemisiae]|uniref:Lipoprotein signal peptidase n=1 Tax=Rhodococcus artemisiae TaxID=714159 RepID=A0ABU7L869_9NOCA|nr:signal peptidase II [Rhodococcus artemisiae]MEE2057102.1 signal peptidase II [Rhodococcus artemisiae]
MTSTPLPGHPTPEASRRYLPWIVAVAAVVVIVDQLTKWWAESTLSDGRAIPVIGEFLQWRLVYNPGAAFGIGGQFTWILTVLAAAAVLGLCIFATRVFNPFWALGVAVLLGGAISHLGDRVFRTPGFARGHVVDFIDYNGFFVGNVADIALVGGAGLLIVLTLVGIDARSRVDADDRGGEPRAS